MKTKFGSKAYFRNYMKNAIEKEGRTQETVARVHFAMSSLILETHKGKEALTMLRNLTEAGEELSHWKTGVNYIE
jgi:hypothetical protein